MKPWSGKKHSAEAQFVVVPESFLIASDLYLDLGISRTPLPSLRKYENSCSLVASMALEAEVVNVVKIAI